MDRGTARLINGIGYRMKLQIDLPKMEARLLSILDEGGEIRTRRWAVKRQDNNLVVFPNTIGGKYKTLPLAFSRDLATRGEECA